ncbi:TPA_asm: RNA-directed RNA polymerase [ssRNA phage Gerhypos.2_19]|uniref:RNA-directed RNA polymerase n=2 Tax=Fiersviridae TaxID=2842319 RepID=A0A8S5L2N6_9VIRU|nr:RNA-directed RNA polymerase [ssRNA phage Gerhypos.2_19]QDH90024.1 MAG: RNA-dependent RNA polymerase [Leviviridae sp.]DAD52078.1 TPA_asm: RNA-directed RNA polymerase [ssRNA phage Gerhypos.2_19]
MGTKRPCPSRGMYRHNHDYATSGAIRLFQALGTDFGETAAGLLERGDFAAVLQLQVDALTYDCADRFRDDYFVAEHLSKFPNFDVGIDRVAVAIEKFRKAEKDCSEANHRLKSHYGKASTTLSVASLIYTARRKIERLLGPLDWDEAEQYFGFGPGSTTSLKRTRGDAYWKFGASKPHVTKECAVLGFAAIRRIPTWFARLAGFSGELTESVLESLSERVRPEDIFQIVPGNRVITVPKNAKTDRVIAVEPDLNMFCQKGLGGVIRSRLKRAGVDLDDQSLNQRLACEGSVNGSLATLDLSAASDSVAMQLVRELLPPDWVEAIETCRSPQGVLPNGEVISYQKVSSMGNGFTFELESLIFWALVHSVLDYSETSERRVAVYGDDLIFSVEIYEPVVELLSFCGFTVNEKKSFATGKFRESCGSHFFSGRDVTPFYVRESVDNPERLLWYSNSIRRWARKGMTWGLDGRLQDSYLSSVKLLPKFWQKPLIPDGLGDIALIGDFDEVRPKKAPRGFSGWLGLGVSRKVNMFLPEDVPILIKGLNNIAKSDDDLFSRISKAVSSFRKDGIKKDVGVVVPLGVVKPTRDVKWQVVKPITEQWESFGPWIHSTASPLLDVAE